MPPPPAVGLWKPYLVFLPCAPSLLCRDDTKKEMEYIVRKLLGLRWLPLELCSREEEINLSVPSDLNFPWYSWWFHSGFGKMMEDVVGQNLLKTFSLKCFVSVSSHSTMLWRSLARQSPIQLSGLYVFWQGNKPDFHHIRKKRGNFKKCTFRSRVDQLARAILF